MTEGSSKSTSRRLSVTSSTVFINSQQGIWSPQTVFPDRFANRTLVFLNRDLQQFITFEGSEYMNNSLIDRHPQRSFLPKRILPDGSLFDLSPNRDGRVLRFTLSSVVTCICQHNICMTYIRNIHTCIFTFSFASDLISKQSINSFVTPMCQFVPKVSPLAKSWFNQSLSS